MIEDIISKKKKCSSCGNVQSPQDSPVFECSDCNHQCVNAQNYWVLKDQYKSKDKVKKLKQDFDLRKPDELSGALSKINRAIENYEQN